MNYTAGDLVLVTYPYVSGTQSKIRPALILLDTGDADVVAARVTTQPVRTQHDIPLNGWRQAGLRAPCTVRLHKLATVDKTSIIRVVGQIDPGDRPKVAAALLQMFGSW
jgi:mRNA interferase MazF